MGDIPYWTSSEDTIKDKDEERANEILKSIKNSTDVIKESNAYFIVNMRLKHESVMNALKLISVVLTISMTINIFLLIALCYSLGVFG